MRDEGHFGDAPRTVYTDLPGSLLGLYEHSTGQVFVDRRMSAARKRCTLVHEAIHRLFGHRPSATPAETVVMEIATERMAALHLIPFPMLLGVLCRYPGDLDAAAEELMVDGDTLLARILGLSPMEQTVVEACGRHCIGYGSEQAKRSWPLEPITSRRVPSEAA